MEEREAARMRGRVEIGAACVTGCERSVCVEIRRLRPIRTGAWGDLFASSLCAGWCASGDDCHDELVLRIALRNWTNKSRT